MPYQTIQATYPRITDNGDGTVTLKLGKISWSEDATAPPMQGVGDRENAIKTHAQMWLVANNVESWADLLSKPVKRSAYHNANDDIKIFEGGG